MTDKTEQFNLTKLGHGEGVHAGADKFASDDRDTIDQALYNGVRHRHTGVPASDGAPDAAPDLSLSTTGGTIPSGVTVHYRYTYIDPDTGETPASPEATVATPSPIPPPGAPSSSQQSIGGALEPGTYSYVLTHYVGQSTVETRATNPVSVTVPAGTSTNEITLDLPELHEDADGFNIYRRGSNQTRFYFLDSAAETATPPAEYYDDGTVEEDCDRTLPPENTTGSTNSVTVTLPGATPSIPDGNGWKLYRSYETSFNNSFLVEQGEEDLDYLDVGAATESGSPPSVSTAQNAPEKVVLTDGAEVQGELPSTMVEVNEQATPWQNLEGETLQEVLSYIDSEGVGGGGSALRVLTIASKDVTEDERASADFVCDGTADQVQFEAAFAEAEQLATDLEGAATIIVCTPGEYVFSDTCTVPNVANVKIMSLGSDPSGNYAPGGSASGEGAAEIRSDGESDYALFTVDNYFHIERFAFMAGGMVTASPAWAIHQTGNISLHIENCRFRAHGLYNVGVDAVYTQVQYITVKRCAINPYEAAGIRVVTNLCIGEIIENALWGTGDYENVTPEDDAVIVINGDENGHQWNPRNRLTIADNYSTGGGFAKIIVKGFAAQTVIRNNKFSTTSGGQGWDPIELHDSRNVVMEGNIIKGGGLKMAGAKEASVIGNIIQSPGRHGITLTDAVDCTVEANSIIDASDSDSGVYSAIFVEGDSGRNLIMGNHISTPSDTATPTSVMLHAIRIEDTTCYDNMVGMNYLPLDIGLSDNGTDTLTGAEVVAYDNTVSGLTAEDVQAALDEVADAAGGAKLDPNIFMIAAANMPSAIKDVADVVCDTWNENQDDLTTVVEAALASMSTATMPPATVVIAGQLNVDMTESILVEKNLSVVGLPYANSGGFGVSGCSITNTGGATIFEHAEGTLSFSGLQLRGDAAGAGPSIVVGVSGSQKLLLDNCELEHADAGGSTRSCIEYSEDLDALTVNQCRLSNEDTGKYVINVVSGGGAWSGPMGHIRDSELGTEAFHLDAGGPGLSGHFSVSGCTFTDGPIVVLENGCEGFAVHDNVAGYAHHGDAALIQGTDVSNILVQGNMLRGQGAVFTDSTDLSIANNVFPVGWGTEVDMLVLTNVNDSIVSGNKFTDPVDDSHAISLTGTSSRNLVTGNMVRASGSPTGAIEIADSTCEDNEVYVNSIGALTVTDNGTGTVATP